MTVAKRMTRDPIVVSGETTVPEARAILKREKISRLPVLDHEKRLIGIVTEFDLVNACPSPASSLDMWEMSYLISKLKVEKVMTRDPITISEDTTVEEAARLMADNDISGLPVMRDRSLVGIITESDLFRIFIELFGARRKGIRATVLLPEKRGELALLSQAIADAGANIVSMATYPGENEKSVLCTFKVEGIPKEALVAAIGSCIEDLVDLRET
jgi:acetoin utilization protein AcuB